MLSKILLIDVDNDRLGNSHKQLFSNWSHHPLGLMYLASACRERFPAIEFKIFHTITSNEPLAKIESLIESFAPDMVGLRALSIARDNFDRIAARVRGLRPSIPILAGGPYPSSSHAHLIQSRLVDLVIIGEGERVFTETVAHFREHGELPSALEGTAVLDIGAPKLNPPAQLIEDLDTIPYPAYDLIDTTQYAGISAQSFQDATKCAFLCASRGCPYHCFYCHQFFGKKIRQRSPDNLVGEMLYHHDERGVRDFVFTDDLFNVPMKTAKKTLRLIIDQLPDIRMYFPNGLRADHMDDELLYLLEKAGVVMMSLAVETATPRLQKMMGKNMQLDHCKEMIQKASRTMVVGVFFMVGFPTETWEEAQATVQFASELKHIAQPTLSIVRVYSGTSLFDQLAPNPEQTEALIRQERDHVHPSLFEHPNFYGDHFPVDKVPLKSKDISKIRYQWVKEIYNNKERISNSHKVLKKHLSNAEIIEYYKNVFNNADFNEASLKALLAK